MRSFIVIAMFAASLSNAAWNGYTEVRNLELSMERINTLEIDAGAGSLEIKGDPDATVIRVVATIRLPDAEAEEAIEIIESDLKLTLEKQRNRAMLNAYFDHGMWGFHGDRRIDLEISMPHGLALVIDDGSGSIHVEAVSSHIIIDDGSGSITVKNVGSLVIDDGSGSITVAGVTGDVAIEDGSGDIMVRAVGGSVTIDDGSGGIDIDDVEHDLIIVDDGSGSVRVSDVRGIVQRDD